MNVMVSLKATLITSVTHTLLGFDQLRQFLPELEPLDRGVLQAQQPTNLCVPAILSAW